MDWRLRIFFALLAMSETNAYLAFNVKNRARGFQPWTRVQWKQQLAKQLLADPLRQEGVPTQLRTRAKEAEQFVPNLHSITHNHYAIKTGTGKDSRVCKVCSELKVKVSKRSKGETSQPLPRSVYRCTCGVTVCNPSQGLSCWLYHLQMCLSQA